MTAIPQLVLSPSEGLPSTTLNSYVTIQIKSEDLISCIKFMLSQGINFDVQYSIKQNVLLPTSKNNDIKYKIASEVCRKYVSVISENPLPEISHIASEFGISAAKLKAFFQEIYKQPLYQAYMQARMEKSAELLRKGYRANAVSKMVGYGDKSAIKFSKMFQKHFGITPKKYQTRMMVEN